MANPDFERAVLPLVPTLRGSAMRLTRNKDDAADLVQDTLIKALKGWPSFDGRGSPKAWLRKIMRNHYIDGWHKSSRCRVANSSVEDIADATLAVDDVCDAVRDRTLVGEAIDELPPDQMLVVWAVDIEGYSYKEAARWLECPIGTVMSRLHRARKNLRAILDERIERAA